MRDIARMERDFTKIDPKYLKYLSFDYKKDRIGRVKKAVIGNAVVLSKIVAEYQSLFDFEKLPNGMIQLKPMFIKPTDVIKMRSTIKSFLRDWSAEVIFQAIICVRVKQSVISATSPSLMKSENTSQIQ